MADRREAIRAELQRLCDQGKNLALRERLTHLTAEQRKAVLDQAQEGPPVGGDTGKQAPDRAAAAARRAKMLQRPDFATEYQAW